MRYVVHSDQTNATTHDTHDTQNYHDESLMPEGGEGEAVCLDNMDEKRALRQEPHGITY